MLWKINLGLEKAWPRLLRCVSDRLGKFAGKRQNPCMKITVFLTIKTTTAILEELLGAINL